MIGTVMTTYSMFSEAGMREGWKGELLKLGKPSGSDMGMIHLVVSSSTPNSH